MAAVPCADTAPARFRQQARQALSSVRFSYAQATFFCATIISSFFLCGFMVESFKLFGDAGHALSWPFQLKLRLEATAPLARSLFQWGHGIGSAVAGATAFFCFVAQLLLQAQSRQPAAHGKKQEPLSHSTGVTAGHKEVHEGLKSTGEPSLPAEATSSLREEAVLSLTQAAIADVCFQNSLVACLAFALTGLGWDPLLPTGYRPHLISPALWSMHAMHGLLGQVYIAKLATQQVQSIGSCSETDAVAPTTVPAPVPGTQQSLGMHTGLADASLPMAEVFPPVFTVISLYALHLLPAQAGIPLTVFFFALVFHTLLAERVAFFKAVLQWEAPGDATCVSVQVRLLRFSQLTMCTATFLCCCFVCVPEGHAHWGMALRGIFAFVASIDNSSVQALILLNRGMALEDRHAYAARLQLEQARAVLLREMDVKKNEFLRYVFHEARVPLNSACLSLEALKDIVRQLSTAAIPAVPRDGCSEGVDSTLPLAAHAMATMNGRTGNMAEAEELLGLAQASCDSVRTIINSLLTLSAVEAKAFSVHLQPADVRAVIADKVAQQRPHAKAIGAQLTLCVEAGVPAAGVRLLFDPVRLGQVVSNLVSNALKFVRQEGGGIVEVRVGLVSDGAGHDVRASEQTAAESVCTLRISVRDNGMGIPAQEQSKLFVPYQQVTSGSAQHGAGTGKREHGTGLGLAISQEIAKQHGGAMGVESSPGHGSLFWCEVRLRHAEVAVQDGQRAGGGEGTAAPGKEGDTTRVPPQKILVVDDSESNRRLLARHMGRHFPAALISQAEDGQQAVEQVLAAGETGDTGVQAGQVDVVLMDGNMPVMNGYEATSSLRSLGYSGLIVGVTGNALRDDLERFKAAGADVVLTKPVTAQEVAEACMLHRPGQPARKQIVVPGPLLPPRPARHAPFDL